MHHRFYTERSLGMKKFLIGLALLAVCGCKSANYFIAENANPQKGSVYQLRSSKLKVVQVCDDCVHVMHVSYNGLRVCIIPLENDYVTDSCLRPGFYEYVGPYTYETIKDKNGNKGWYTVRLFKEVESPGK